MKFMGGGFIEVNRVNKNMEAISRIKHFTHRINSWTQEDINTTLSAGDMVR